MRITARATVEIEVEIMDALVEHDMDINDPDTLVGLIDGQGTSEAIVNKFFEATDLELTADEVPDRVGQSQLDWEEYYREVLKPQLMGA